MFEAPPVDLTVDQARHIAAAMLEVSAADGTVPNEIRIIDAFIADLPGPLPGRPDLAVFSDPPLKDVFLWSTALVALADGDLSEAERAVLDRYTVALGLSAVDLDRVLFQVRCHLLDSFRGITHFREEAVVIGKDLGLDEAEIAAVLDGKEG